MASIAPPARRRLALEEVGSTNTVAMEAARSGDPGPLWVTAERQVAGRGRRSRRWVSERGNLYASLLLVDPAPPTALLNLPLVASLGVRNGIARLMGESSAGVVSIKWPNDVLVHGRKCAGILIESERLPDGRTAAIVGCGINVEHVPSDVPYPVTGLRQEGSNASVNDAFEAIADAVETAIRQWARGANFAETRTAWLRHAAGVGLACRVNLHDGSIEGVFKGLDDDGRMILVERSGAARHVSAGDVFLLGPNVSSFDPADAAAE